MTVSQSPTKYENIRQRIVADKILFWLVCILSCISVIPLFSILGELIINGLPQINIDFFIKTSPDTMEALIAKNSGESIPGGIANGIIGTLLMVIMASVIAIPTGIACGIYISENRNRWFAKTVRFLAEILQSMPSIIIGIITYIAIVIPLKGYSALAGSISLAIMMLPLIVRSTEETLNMLPISLKESGLSLGASYSSTIIKIILPSAYDGIITGILLSISRVIGETAPLMLTALGCNMIQWNITKPSSAIPLLIWEFYNDPNLQSMIWSASLFLIILVFGFNLLAKKIQKNNIK